MSGNEQNSISIYCVLRLASRFPGLNNGWTSQCNETSILTEIIRSAQHWSGDIRMSRWSEEATSYGSVVRHVSENSTRRKIVSQTDRLKGESCGVNFSEDLLRLEWKTDLHRAIIGGQWTVMRGGSGRFDRILVEMGGFLIHLNLMNCWQVEWIANGWKARWRRRRNGQCCRCELLTDATKETELVLMSRWWCH